MGVLDPNTRYAMAKFAGDGVTTDFTINFLGGWINVTDLIAYSTVTGDRDDIIPLTLTLLSSSTAGDLVTGHVRVSAATPVGRTLYIVRETQRGEPLVDFVNRSMLTEANLNIITEQAIYSVAEMEDQFEELTVTIGDAADLAVATANEAKSIAQDADATADAALIRANDAYDKGVAAEAGIAAATTAANAAQTAANQANQAASDATMLVASVQGTVQEAVDTANAASATANAAADAANAISDEAADAHTAADAAQAAAEAATVTANSALTTANGVDAKATAAQADAASALASAAAKLDKVVSTAQSVVGPVTFGAVTTFSAEVDFASGLVIKRDRVSAGATLIDFRTSNGATSWGKVFADTSGISLNANAAGSDPGASIAVFTAGNITLAGSTSTNKSFSHMLGATGTQQITRRVGWETGGQGGVQRYAEVLDAGGGMSHWTYNTAGGNPYQAYSLQSVNSNAGIPTAQFNVNGQVRGTQSYSHSNFSVSCPILAVGVNAAIGWANTNDGRNRVMFVDAGSGTTIHYELNSSFTLSQAGAGGFSHAGGFQVLSDERTKYNLKPLKADWARFMAVRPQTGKYRKAFCQDGGKQHMFLVAQNLQPHYPQLVKAPVKWDKIDDLLTVDYDQAVPVLWAMIQSLRNELDELKEARK